MKLHNRIHQFCAFSLILLFTIQAGLGLWLHRALHQHTARPVAFTKSNVPVVQQAAAISIACTCTDDFLVPFISVQNTEIPAPFTIFFTTVTPADYSHVSTGLHVFRPLRGPPVLAV